MVGDFSLPTNFHDLRKEHTGIILDEMGLGRLANELVLRVLVPLSRLLFPDWLPWSIDSYHAFTIHKSVGESETQENRRSHMDVCESSMNVCLGGEFNGSSVHFTPNGQGFASAFHTFDVEHIPGRAFINLCQHYHGVNPMRAGQRHVMVLRAMSSYFRRSPGELFCERCMQDDGRLVHNTEL